jgi:hypothetical protein
VKLIVVVPLPPAVDADSHVASDETVHAHPAAAIDAVTAPSPPALGTVTDAGVKSASHPVTCTVHTWISSRT